VSVKVDYTVLESGSVLEIDDRRFPMYGKGSNYWIYNRADEPLLLDSMRRSSKIIMRGQTAQGTQNESYYSLKGFPWALDRAEQECRSPGLAAVERNL
jgi:hypothetical protein